MNAIIIYKSKTGFTKRYAEWIAEALCCSCAPLAEAKKIDLGQYNTLIFGSSLFAGSVYHLKDFQEKLNSFKGEKAIFAVGAMPPNAPQIPQIIENCAAVQGNNAAKIFYMQGGLDYAKMNFVHKAMMKMMCRMLKKQKGAQSEEYMQVSRSFDAADKGAIAPLVDYIQGK